MLVTLKEIAYYTSIDINELMKAAERISVEEKEVLKYNKGLFAVDESLIPKLLLLTGSAPCTLEVSAIEKNWINRNNLQILTKKEKGTIKFLSTLEEFKNSGFKAEDYKLPVNVINIITIVIMMLLVYFVDIFYRTIAIYSFLLIIVIFPVTMVLHEFLHAVGFTIRGNVKWKGNIKFGILLKKMMAYCHCSSPVPYADFLLAAILPFAVLGLGLLAIGMVVESDLLVVVSIINIVMSIGDLYMICWLLLVKRPSIILALVSKIKFGNLISTNNHVGLWQFSLKGTSF